MENNRLFFNQILERRLEGVCLWENFDDKDKRTIYKITGRLFTENGRNRFGVYYLKEGMSSSKTAEEMIQDYVATPADLIELGRSLVRRTE